MKLKYTKVVEGVLYVKRGVTVIAMLYEIKGIWYLLTCFEGLREGETQQITDKLTELNNQEKK